MLVMNFSCLIIFGLFLCWDSLDVRKIQRTKFVDTERVNFAGDKHQQMNTYVPPEGIEGFHDEILRGGEALVAVSSFKYPDANAVSNVISRVHEIVAEWGLMGMWVTTQVAGGGLRYD